MVDKVTDFLLLIGKLLVVGATGSYIIETPEFFFTPKCCYF